MDWGPTAWRHTQYYDHALLRLKVRTDLARRRPGKSDRRPYAAWLRDDTFVSELIQQSEDNSRLAELEQLRRDTNDIIDMYCKANFAADDTGQVQSKNAEATKAQVADAIRKRHQLLSEAAKENFDKARARMSRKKYKPTGTNYKPPRWTQDLTEFKLRQISAKQRLGKQYNHARCHGSLQTLRCKWLRRRSKAKARPAEVQAAEATSHLECCCNDLEEKKMS